MWTKRQSLFLGLACFFFSTFVVNLSAQTMLVPYKVDSLFGYSDLEGKLRIDPQFHKVHFFDPNGYARVELKGQSALIDSLGNTIRMYADRIPEGQSYFDEISRSGNSYRVRDDGYTMYVDLNFRADFECPFSLGKRLGYVAEVTQRENRKRLSSIVDQDCRLLLPFSENRTWLYTMDGKAHHPIIGRKHEQRIFLYDPTGTPLLDSIYDKVHTLVHEGQQFYVLVRGGELDILYDNLEVAYENLHFQDVFDTQAYASVKRKSSFSLALLVKLFNLHKGFQCFISINDDCICYDTENKAIGSYINGKSMLAKDEFGAGWNSNRTIYALTGPEGELRVKNTDGHYIKCSEPVDSLLWNYHMQAIVALQGENYAFFDLAGNRTHDFIATDYTHWSIQKQGSPRYAFHYQTGIPLTGFDYVDIIRTNWRNKFLGKTDQGYDILDTLGNVLFHVPCDTLYHFASNSRYWAAASGDQTGIYKLNGELIVPIAYEKIERTIAHSDLSGFRAFSTGEAHLYSPDGYYLPLNEKFRMHGKLSFWATGNFRIDDKDEDLKYFFTPEGKLLTSRKGSKGEIHGAGREQHLFWLDGAYFNYTNGVYYGSE